LPPGVGKSHLAIALGIKACEQGVRTLFITATALITHSVGGGGGQARRAAQITQSAGAFNHRRDWLFPDRPPGANLFFYWSRAGTNTAQSSYQQSESGCLGEVFDDTVSPARSWIDCCPIRSIKNGIFVCAQEIDKAADRTRKSKTVVPRSQHKGDMQKLEYKGYVIRYQFTGAGWFAYHRASGSSEAAREGHVAATPEEGTEKLLERTREAIDAMLAASK
jgi:hypothetical protein